MRGWREARQPRISQGASRRSGTLLDLLSPMPPQQLSRTFTDSVGVEWTVREIATPKLTGTLVKLLEHDRRRGGWLVFESAEDEKRRLAPYPPDWRTMSDFEIERWCMRATRVPPGPARRAED